MQNPQSFYEEQLKDHRQAAQKLYKQLSVLSILRLLVFILTGTGIYYTFTIWQLALGIGIAGSILFLILLSRYTDLKQKRGLHQRLAAINQNELRILSGHFYHQPEGKEFQDAHHHYSLDIDLFGRGSFFQYLNRSTIKEGTQHLVEFMLANKSTGIKARQEAIKELAAMPQWRQRYTGIAMGVEVEHSAASIIQWLKGYTPFLKTWHYYGSLVFSVLSIVILVLAMTQTIAMGFLGYWLLLGLGLTGLYLKKIQQLAQHTDKAKDTFRQYALLLNEIEQQNFSAPLLEQQQTRIQAQGTKASAIFRRFSKALDALDNRNNFISAIFGNGYLLWDIRQSYTVERWISTYAHTVEDWFEVVTFFDAMNSLGTFAFNHQDFVYPKISQGHTTLEAQDLGHPLLPKTKRITSSVTLRHEAFFIVTGANMAGKSTFLRTVALHIVMANMGLPVCASSSTYRPIRLITSMRTTDSLTDDSSYFFSELTRLKFIVETLSESKEYFVILDEILKGTNSTDKAIGSRQFVERLVNLRATGIIATHDLSLTEVASQLPQVKNYFFDAQIKNDELFFDYKLKPGVCETMNASFLLKKMKIVE
jgi:hypothetical protein